jgi:type II secretory ATPase GspE/PulE/Tfp pilus assembly ATPase PilB-like protein
MTNPDIERALATLSRKHGLIEASAAVRLIRDARTSARPLGDLVRESIAETDLLAAVATELGVRYVDLNRRDLDLVNDNRILGRCDLRFLGDKATLPLVNRDGQVVVVMANPLDTDAVTYMRSRFPEGFSAVLAARSQILARILTLTSDLGSEVGAGPNAVPEWVDRMLSRAVAERASDLHFRFLGNGEMMVRIRVDGVLRQVRFPDALRGRELEIVGTVLARCPTIDPSNVREPQDGTFSFSAGGRQIDVRVGMLPQVTGTNLTLRLLDSLTLRRRPEEMGFRAEHLSMMRNAVSSAQGCIVVVGPTGSGKTTTLYSLLREVDAVSRNVLTVEDPVEYRLPYIGQTQIRSDLGDRSLTWSRALRSIVRNDPDVILVGEVRDADVAKVAAEAAITGHMVLTTLHAHSAIGAFSRLVQMGVPSYLVSEAVSLVVSQRLVRHVHDCARLEPPTADEKALLTQWHLPIPDQVAHTTGCQGCAGTGYRGRLSAAEVLNPDARFRTLVASGAPSDELREAALGCGWQPIRYDGLRLLCAGQTTVAELSRALSDAEGDDARAATESGDE